MKCLGVSLNTLSGEEVMQVAVEVQHATVGQTWNVAQEPTCFLDSLNLRLEGEVQPRVIGRFSVRLTIDHEQRLLKVLGSRTTRCVTAVSRLRPGIREPLMLLLLYCAII